MSRKAKASTSASVPARLDEWERNWQEHWSKAGLPGYELPDGGPGKEDRDFLGNKRTLVKEKQRLRTDSPKVAVDLIVRSLPAAVRRYLRPLKPLRKE